MYNRFVAVFPQFSDRFFSGQVRVQKDRLSYADCNSRKFLKRKARFAVRDRQWDNRQIITIRHCKRAFLERSYRSEIIPAGTFGENMNPFFLFVYFVKGLVKIFYYTYFFRYRDAAGVADKPHVFASKLFFPYREIHRTVTDSLQNKKKIPAVNMIANCYRSVF